MSTWSEEMEALAQLLEAAKGTAVLDSVETLVEKSIQAMDGELR